MKGGRRFVAAGLLLAALVAAQDDPFAGRESEALADARQRLAALTDADAEWRAPVRRRIELLEELQRNDADRKALPSPEQVEKERAEAQRGIDELSREPVPTEIGLASPEAAARYDAALAEARKARDARQKDVETLAGRRAGAEAERRELSARERDARTGLGELAKSEDELSRYRADNARLELRVVRERNAFLDDAAPIRAARAPVLDLQLELARLRCDVAEKEQKLAAAEAARLREAEADRIREAAEAEARQAELTVNPIERFRLERSAETARVRAGNEALQGRAGRIQASIAERKELMLLADQRRKELESRLARGDEGTAALLRGVLERTRRLRQILRTALEDAYARSEAVQKELVQVLDRLWELELPDDDNPVLEQLLASVGPSRQDEAKRVFRESVQGTGGVVSALRAERTTLEHLENLLGEYTTLLLEHEARIEEVRLFVGDRILWVRSEPRVDGDLLAEAVRELVTLPVPYARARLWTETGVTRAAALAGLGLAAFIVFLLAARLRARGRPEAPTPGWRAATGRWILGLVAAALPAAALYGASLGVRALDLPATLAGPVPVLLDLVALLVLVRRVAAFLLREGGLLVATVGLPAPVAKQLLASVRLITIAALLLRVPAAVISAKPFAATALPRLLDAAWYATLGFALYLLVRRRGAIVQDLTRPGSLMRGLWALMGIATVLLTVAALALDLLGYRVGSSFLILNVARTVGLLVLIAGFYSSLLALVGKVAARVRSQAMRSEGAVTAWQMSSAVVGQLTRLVAAVVAVFAIVLFLRFWGLSGTLSRALGGVHLLELAGGNAVTLWNAITALLWVVGGHFVARNLSAVYDTIISPLFRQTDAAGRYVFLALSRYAILVCAYGFALLTLQVSFASIGWLLAAISFGVGFGLQEIVANFVSGLIILLERPIRVGDFIEVNGKVAVVDRINIRSTTVTNLDRQTMIIPNKELITQNLTNWSRNDRLMRRQFRVGVAYGSDVEKVLRVLDEEVRRHPRVLRDPPPAIRFAQFGESSLDFDVFFYATIDDGLQALADLHRQVYERFGKERIEIPFPQRDLHLRSGWEQLERGEGR
ncbi:MAG TPA: mechanosensitive ion channel domain-containing protein [Planctomycetota bacterium]|nr:mechanosensitive ion channel domain-containing protein [Planctomycetota bacterium]